MKYQDLQGLPLLDSEPYRFWRRLGMAVLAALVFIAVQVGVFLAAGLGNITTLWMMAMHAVTAAALLLLVWVQYRSAGGIRALMGQDLLPGLKLFVPLLVLAYVVLAGLNLGLGLGREDFMVQFFAGLNPWQVAACLLMLVIFPPLSEELMFRHFLMRLFPLNHGLWKWLAVAFSSVLFMLVHTQYEHWPTLVLIGVIGVILSVARVWSKGLLLPVALHSSAEVIGMTTDWLLGQLGAVG